MSKKFEYKYTAPTMEERKEIDSIRRQYLPTDKSMTKMDRLRYLDRKVKGIPQAVSISFGVVGILMFGTGMTFFLEWVNYWYIGIPFAIVGVILMSLAYLVYVKLLTKLKNKYGKEIIELSNELLNEENENNN